MLFRTPSQHARLRISHENLGPALSQAPIRWLWLALGITTTATLTTMASFSVRTGFMPPNTPGIVADHLPAIMLAIGLICLAAESLSSWKQSRIPFAISTEQHVHLPRYAMTLERSDIIGTSIRITKAHTINDQAEREPYAKSTLVILTHRSPKAGIPVLTNLSGRHAARTARRWANLSGLTHLDTTGPETEPSRPQPTSSP